jgi:hypothetical protein
MAGELLAAARPVVRATFDYLPSRRRIQRLNKWLAVRITRGVGTMWCAYVFALLALVSLPATLAAAGFITGSHIPTWLVGMGLISLVAWVAQTFLQLVLLSVIIVGQNVQAEASDDRAQRLLILDRLDPHTEGGISEVLADIQAHLARQDQTLQALADYLPLE